MNCPKCDGRREIVLDSKPTIIHSVEDEPYRIISYRYTVYKDGEFLRYKIKQGYGKEKSVTEEEIFAMREEAVKVCDDLNDSLSESKSTVQVLDRHGNIQASYDAE